MGSLPMDFYRGWVLDVHAGVADDGALDRGSGGVVSDSSDTQNVDQIRTQATHAHELDRMPVSSNRPGRREDEAKPFTIYALLRR